MSTPIGGPGPMGGPRRRRLLLFGAAVIGLVVGVAACGAGSPSRGAVGTPGTAPPPLTVLTRDTSDGNGDIFIAPAGGTYPAGPEIITTAGKVVWFHRLPAGEVATDFRTQTYLGQPVLTWFQSSRRPRPPANPRAEGRRAGLEARGLKSARTAPAAPTTSTTTVTTRSPRSGRATGPRPTSTSSSSRPGTPR